MSTKDTIAVQRCRLSAKELNEFLSSYPIPSKYDVILPTSTQTIFDAPTGYVGLYTHSFSLANLRLPLTDFFCEVLQYFKVHISRLNPFGCAKLTTFIIMCKAYGCEPSVDLFQDSIISSKYPQLLFDENMLNLKSFKDKLPPNIDENPYFQRLGRYPTSVRVFDDPILFLAGLKPSWEFGQQRHAIIVSGKEMAFRNFIYTEYDDDLAFLPKEPSPRFDRKDVVSKVVPYAAMELVHSDELGRLVGTLVSSAITYGRCRAYEQVAAMKEPFDLSKAKGYRSSYTKENTQASNDFATTTFPWLDNLIADAAALIEALLSKKPPTLQKPAPSRTQMPVHSSQKATPSSTPSSNPMSPPADLVKPSPSSFE
ncbi:hypothetical protein Tco_0140530 [Tanacetum coccineum]